MVREVCLANDKEPRDGRLKIVIDPKTTHRVVDSRENTHGRLIRVVVGNALVHLKEIAVAFSDFIFTHSIYRVCKIEIDAGPVV